MSGLPRSVEELARLSDEQKIMLAAVTASGCDAVAYYAADGNGGYVADQIIQLYPPAHYRATGAQPQFGGTLGAYDPGTHRTAEEVMSHKEYHIPVPLYGADGAPTQHIKGVIVLHAPQEGFGRIQENADDDKKDMHEPVEARLAKLKMAQDIVGEHQDLFGAAGKAKSWDRHNDIKAKLAYFRRLIKDSQATMGAGNDQNAHTEGVAQFMDAMVQNILNKDPANPRISNDQAELIHDLTELHDIGKSQMSSAFMKPWRHVSSQAAKDYFFEENHNHPLFTMLELLLYPTEAKLAASHHHGVFRYGSEELKHALGEDFSKYTILKDNMRPEEISPLAYLMRIADVAESMTGRGDKSLDEAVKELGEKAEMKDGKPVVTPGSIHADYLCLAIHSGAFDASARNKNPEKLKEAEAEILKKFNWTPEKEAALVAGIANDPLLRDPNNRGREMARV